MNVDFFGSGDTVFICLWFFFVIQFYISGKQYFVYSAAHIL